MNIQILCSTMYGVKPLFLKKDLIFSGIVVINQCDLINQEVDNYFNVYEKGLSKSRNLAIESAQLNICIVADNDVYYKENYSEIILSSFSNYPEADILTFMVETPAGEPFKKYKKDMFWHNRLSLAKVSSIEIVFKRESIIEKNIKFDERFGLGSLFPTGEEYIFLNDALNAGLKIAFIPKVIVYHPKESSGNRFEKLELIEAKGAMISRIFGLLGLPICLLFSIKKFRISPYSFYKFFKSILLGYLKVKSHE